jgi:energy-converting hydrogenase A subunit R
LTHIFVSDCEGPVSKNDNAFELAAHFIPNGDKLFANISKYDDVLADVFQKPGYSAGSTLRLILPFFKAYDITDSQMEEFSAQNILLIADSQTTFHHVQTIASTFIVSTSYQYYIKPLCEVLDFPYENTYCTKVSLDAYAIAQKERERLQAIAHEIAQMSLIDIPPATTSTDDFSVSDRAKIQRLDEIFWSELPRMNVGRMISDVVTIGGMQKAEAVKDAARILFGEPANVMYVGDSITDVEAFRLVRDNGGLAVSFNGNGYAVRNAEVAVLSDGNLVMAVVADLFFKLGKRQTLDALSSWSFETLRKSKVDKALLELLGAMPKVQIVTAKNMEMLVAESSEFRKKVRGVAIGRLG